MMLQIDHRGSHDAGIDMLAERLLSFLRPIGRVFILEILPARQNERLCEQCHILTENGLEQSLRTK
jgi:hypothetical protein